MSRVGVVLSGCGVFDGAEIHETVFTLLALDRAGATAVCMAPNIDQMHVMNHLTGNPSEGEKRNVLVESARICRGNITDIKNITASNLDALVFPGGFGAAKNLSDFASKGKDCDVFSEVDRLINEMLKAKKPIGAACIAPVIISKICEINHLENPVKITIGNDPDTAKAIGSMGSVHINCPTQEFVVDEINKIVTTPAYMLANSISQVNDGIEKWIAAVLSLIKN